MEFIKLLGKFRKFQLDNDEPYGFDLLGFMEWLEFDEKIYKFEPEESKKADTPVDLIRDHFANSMSVEVDRHYAEHLLVEVCEDYYEKGYMEGLKDAV